MLLIMLNMTMAVAMALGAYLAMVGTVEMVTVVVTMPLTSAPNTVAVGCLARGRGTEKDKAKRMVKLDNRMIDLEVYDALDPTDIGRGWGVDIGAGDQYGTGFSQSLLGFGIRQLTGIGSGAAIWDGIETDEGTGGG